MYEFDSVSVSSFEAASLAATLTEKSADGWDVVTIIPAGSDVVAYLRRATTNGEAPAAEVAELAEASTEPAEEAGEQQPAAANAEELLTSASTSEPAAPAVKADTGGTGWGAADTSGATASSWGDSGDGAESSSWGGSAQQTAPSVPAGWYADPAGRFELRYWDGNAWTEHVSRQGQQYTDPPVA